MLSETDPSETKTRLCCTTVRCHNTDKHENSRSDDERTRADHTRPHPYTAATHSVHRASHLVTLRNRGDAGG